MDIELGSFPNSNHNMELEQIKTKAYHYLPQDFISSLDLIVQNNIKKTGTLGHYDFTIQKVLDFYTMSNSLINHIVTGLKQFFGYYIGSFREITLSVKIFRFFVQYYSDNYPNYDFYNKNQLPKLKQLILVSSTAH
ncbi:34689_t:CDS:2 [Racocetra persica]|uniref:34689_t:CDS:1 n=1 Tax=Racocetra persica TaxID=160502 RepID=A0ACA9LMV5_9GLOM|nr:34689_t:CDS:2 [Racocetra persica]